MKTGERLLEFIHSLGIDPSEFADAIGISRTTLHHIVSGKGRGNDPSKETIEKISKKYPALNINWLLTGNGERGISNAGPKIEDQEIELHPAYRRLWKKYTELLEKVNDLKL